MRKHYKFTFLSIFNENFSPNVDSNTNHCLWVNFEWNFVSWEYLWVNLEEISQFILVSAWIGYLLDQICILTTCIIVVFNIVNNMCLLFDIKTKSEIDVTYINFVLSKLIDWLIEFDEFSTNTRASSINF